MDISEFVLMLLLNGLPVICLAIPIPFIFKKTVGKLYIRIFLGIFIFFLVYWVLPLIFQGGIQAKELSPTVTGQEDTTLGFSFIIVHLVSLIGYFLQYPFSTLTFIFVIGPIISFLILRRKLRKEEGTMEEKLSEVTYELKMSPSEMIKQGLKSSDWSEEKDLLKLLIILLPISMYLLSVLIDLLGLESFSLTTGTTAMGWFVEILFVYLATILFGIHLLFSSKISFKGNYVGENVRENVFRSMIQVGTPISVLSIVLFVANYSANLFIILYFFAYFIMASIIFVLFLKIFEPISILMLIKFIDWWKTAKKKLKEIDWTNFYIPLILGIVVSLVFFTVFIFGFQSLRTAIIADQLAMDLLIEGANINYTDTLLLEDALKLDLYNIINTCVIITSIILAAYFFAFGMRYIKRITITSIMYLTVCIIVSLLIQGVGQYPLILFAAEDYWITGGPSYFTLLGQNFYTLRTILFEANLTTAGGFPLLEYLAVPYIYTRYVLNIIIWGLIFYYYNKKFDTKNIPKGTDIIERIAFSEVIEFPKYDDYWINRYRYLVSKVEGAKGEGEEEKREDVQELLERLKVSQFIEALKPEDSEERKRLYFTLKYLFYKDKISIWVPEFSYEYERAEIQGLYIMYTDGRDVFSHNFLDVEYADPALISGMFSAISAFIKETTKSSQLLRNIDHGDITIQIEYGKWVFSALFIKGKQSLETRSRLREFVDWFEERHGEILIDWTGATHPFKNDHEKALEVFKED